MSGPFCETCVHFRPVMLGSPDDGECADPSKIIDGPAGDDWSSAPPVHKRCSCRNHETRP